MDRILTERVALGISLCCLGAPVRWNRRGWRRLDPIGREADDFRWHPVCPECMAGFSVPRDPIRIAGKSGDDVWEGRAKVVQCGRDVTEALKAGSLACLETLRRAGVAGYVFMEGSPSCGVYRTSLKDGRLGSPPGLFGSLVLKEGLFLIPALDLESPVRWWDWRRRLHAFVWLRGVSVRTKAELYATWHTFKFLAQELDEPAARAVGRDLAGLRAGDVRSAFETLRSAWLERLRRPSTQARIENRLWKAYVHYKRETGETLDCVKPPKTPRGKSAIAAELARLERASRERGLLFGPSPALYRAPRKGEQDRGKSPAEDEA